MKKINKNIFIIALICAIFAFLLVQVDMITVKQKLNNGSREAADLMNKYNFEGEVQDAEGYAMVISRGLGATTQISNAIILLILAGADALFIFNTILYLILYMTSWLIIRKKETKSKAIVSIVLNGIAIIIQTIMTYIVLNISIGKNIIDVLVISAGIVQLVAIIAIIITYIFNIKEIKSVLNKKNGEKA